jgi:hypothetical protein
MDTDKEEGKKVEAEKIRNISRMVVVVVVVAS